MSRWHSGLLLALLLAPRAAEAHAVGLSRGQYTALPDGLGAELSFAPAELGPALEPQRLLEQIHVSDASGKACPGSLEGVHASDATSLTLRARFRCVEPAALRVELAFWEQLSPGHRHAVESQLYQRERPSFSIEGAAPELASPGLMDWLKLGVEHILTGYDHLAFLFALALVATTWRKLAACVSVFTLAHSVTLALAALDVVAPPSVLVEAAIALSICYVGIENLTERAARPRYALVFAFGLIHGFGFAGALRELGLGPARTPLALFGFNLGVELGQLGLLACVFPLLLGLRRGVWFARRGVPALSAAIALAGALWFAERARDVRLPDALALDEAPEDLVELSAGCRARQSGEAPCLELPRAGLHAGPGAAGQRPSDADAPHPEIAQLG
jgi:hydrogenase/urease accessory protein HupE